MLVLSTDRSRKKFPISLLLNSWCYFWERHFLLQIGLTTLLVTSFYSNNWLFILLLSASLLFSFLSVQFPWYRSFCCGLVFFSLAYLHPVPLAHRNDSETIGKNLEGIFTPEKVTKDKRGNFLLLQGKIQITQNDTNYLAPLWISVPFTQAAYPQYSIKGICSSKQPLKFQRSNLSITPLRYNTSLPFHRFAFHNAIHDWIMTQTAPYCREGQFLSALLIGTKPEEITRRSFAHNGLQHILAISGLHFGLIGAIVTMLCFWIPHLKTKRILILLLLSLYFLLLSPSPSILRAYIASAAYLITACFGRKLLPLNALGLGMSLGCYIDPMSEQTLSFELSFLATFAILLLFKPISTWLIRTKSKTHPRILLRLHRFMIQNLSITLAASSMTIPFLLSTFHQFPLLSLYWNLFIPSLVGFGMMFFILSTCLVPLTSTLSHYLIRSCCIGLEQILNLLQHTKSHWNYTCQLPMEVTTCMGFCFAIIGILLFKKTATRDKI